MKITHVFAQNFCKFYGKNTLDTDFSMKIVLSGQNEVGKSTVKRIILDQLFIGNTYYPQESDKSEGQPIRVYKIKM